MNYAKSQLLVCLLVLVFCTSGSKAVLAQTTISGKADIYGAAYIHDDSRSKEQFAEIRFQPKVTSRFNEYFIVFVAGDFRLDTENYAHSFMDDTVEDSNRWAANASEVYGEFNRSWLRVRAGKQIFDWSVTDTISPSDNINPRDWTDIIEWERVGVHALDVRLGSDTYIEFVYVPWATVSKLPGKRFEVELPDGVSLAKQRINRSAEQFAARAGTVINGFDLCAGAYKGKSFNPATQLKMHSLTSAEVVPVYQDEEVYFLSAAKELIGFNFRAETGFFRQQQDDNFAQGVVGADREWAGVFKPEDTLYVLVQYADEMISKRHDSALPQIDFRRNLNNSLLSRIKYSFNENWAVKLDSSYNFSKGDSYIEPTVVWQQNRWEVEAGMGIFSGPKNTFFGRYKDDDRFFMKTTYNF